ncbi:hypothetical protein ILUMI_15564 [Ignelater luminosus]|uniref:Uncharacterized protein n=1 Tax=Ignelater luminosus TaxID=2038154 RepID=A0A8K0G8Z8_IGNLU|nr:hypothetical protein ILUMI_15564 [Ignelater luminosus]
MYADLIRQTNNTILYFLKNENGLDVKICKKFFLATLGYTLKNDRRLRNIITMNDPADLQPRPLKLGHPSQNQSIPTCRAISRGVSKEKKANLILKLKSIAPKNRLKFWKDLISENPAELDDDIYLNV